MSGPITAAAPEPSRILEFVRFFKGYMNASSVVAAALPIPVTSLQFIPTYSAHTKFLTVYASLSCFLLLGFVFYSRHTLARWMFRPLKRRRPRFGAAIGLLPFFLIVACCCLIGEYHWLLQQSVTDATTEWIQRGVDIGSTVDVLQKTDYMDIPGALGLVACYIGIFLTAEGAFVLMAIREYLQDLLGLTEGELIADRPGRQ
jgi:hypothetical protein